MSRHRHVRNQNWDYEDDYYDDDYDDYADDYDDQYYTKKPQRTLADNLIPQQKGKASKKKGAVTQPSDNADDVVKQARVQGQTITLDTKQSKDLGSQSSVTPAKKSDSSGGDKHVDPKANQLKNKEIAKDGATPNKDVTAPVSKKKKGKLIDVKREYEKEQSGMKNKIHVVVVGHVDAGKSTLMGHVLYLKGDVSKRDMHKFETESAKLGKASFKFAWVLDSGSEERARGVTMDIAQSKFETDSKDVVLLDAPGHRDFVPNMILGASQADIAILVISAASKEFESGFNGGLTQEHTILVRSLGAKEIIVVINKMDQCEWKQERYEHITQKMKDFLKKVGFAKKKIHFLPVSGLNGDNLIETSKLEAAKWYNGPPLIEILDKLEGSPPVDFDIPLRLAVSDIVQNGGVYSVSGKLLSGCVQTGEVLLALPAKVTTVVKGLQVSGETRRWAVCGDSVELSLGGLDEGNLSTGSVLCPEDSPAPSTKRFKAQIVVFDLDVPITRKFPVMMHVHQLSRPATIYKLDSTVDRATGEVLQKKPRLLSKGDTALVEITLDDPVSLEEFANNKALGRFMLRYGGKTVAAGVVKEIR
eukprot:m.228172 g.228172  ORF g.228172 m.228172 type:complete len:588 (-) comp15976_c1_seq14:1401-3164(-)